MGTLVLSFAHSYNWPRQKNYKALIVDRISLRFQRCYIEQNVTKVVTHECLYV